MYPVIMSLGETLNGLRIKNGLTLKDVGERVGKSKQMIGYYESNKNQPTIDTLSSLAELFGVPVSVLLEESQSVYTGSGVSSQKEKPDKHHDRLIPVRVAEDHEQVMIEVIPISARAGFGYVAFMNRPAQEKEYQPVPTSWLKAGVAHEDHSIVEVDGDSMEPKLTKGSKVLTYRLAPGMFAKLGKIVMIDFMDELIIKRLVAVDWMNSSITVKSDNGGMQMTIPMKDIRAMHHVYRVYDAEL